MSLEKLDKKIEHAVGKAPGGVAGENEERLE